MRVGAGSVAQLGGQGTQMTAAVILKVPADGMKTRVLLNLVLVAW